MKKIILTTLLLSVIQLNAQGVLDVFHPQIGLNNVHTWHTEGTYYNGCSWIFYPSDTFTFGTRIRYSKIRINQDGTTEMVADSMGNTTWNFPFTVKDSHSGMSAVVFKGLLYLFVTNKNDSIMYYRTDGTNWIGPKPVGATAKSMNIGWSTNVENLATAVMNGKLFLLKQNIGSGIKLMSSADGETWITKEIIFKNSDNTPPSSLALTTFVDNSKEHLLIGINGKNSYVTSICWDKNNGLYNDVSIPAAKGNGISLVTGRVNYGTGIEYLPVQCLIKGTDDRIWIASYSPQNSTWFNLHAIAEMPNDKTYYGLPSAFSNFKYKSDGSLVKQVWVSTMLMDNSTFGLGIYRVKSEVLKNTETITTKCDSFPSLWTLIGVVEGPPPYVLNGQSFSDLQDPPSVFTYGSSQSSETVNSIESKISTSISASVPLAEGVFTAGFDMSAALSDFKSTTYSTSYTYSSSVVAGEYKRSYSFFMVPTITRYKYESFTPSTGTATGEYEYVFAVTGASLKPVDSPLTRFDPSDITSYVGKDPTSYETISQKGFSWAVQSPWNSEFTQSTSTEQTYSSSIGIGMSMEIPEILKVSANYDLTLSETHTTTFGKSITISIDCPNPRSGHTEDVKAFSGTAYWLKAPKDGNAFWIPKKYSKQRPWCVTWSVNDITYNDLTDVKDDEALPYKFELFQNYPNPFNPSTTINYSIAKTGFVILKVYNMLGQEAAILVNKNQTSGRYSADFNAENLASGIYIYRLQVGNKIIGTKTMTLLK